MAWLFHIVERDDHTWTCRHGNHVYDTHSDYEDALQHMWSIVSERRPAEIVVHRRNGDVTHVADLQL